MKKQFAIINWTDAALHGHDSFSEKELKDLGLVNGIAIGIIAKEDKKSITLAMDWFYDLSDYRNLSTYPKSGINKIIRKEIKSNEKRQGQEKGRQE